MKSRFQFPSNGKGFPNDFYSWCDCLIKPVSIPFKRERLSERVNALFALILQSLFQFPSNGKGFPNENSLSDRVKNDLFQFPSNGKGFPNSGGKYNVGKTEKVFQFPSNGKGFPNAHNKEKRWILTLVSIPFKRERLSERRLGKTAYEFIVSCFNSLQTGKAFRTSQRTPLAALGW